jgi:hypothetical protein
MNIHWTNILIFTYLLHVSNPRVHLQEDSCMYSYSIICVRAEGINSSPTRLLIALACKKIIPYLYVDTSWNVMAHAQKPDFVFRWNGRVHLNWRGRQFSRLLSAEVCASAVVMLNTACSEVVWRVLATHSIRQFPLHLHSRSSPCAITFQLESTTVFLNMNPRVRNM